MNKANIFDVMKQHVLDRKNVRWTFAMGWVIPKSDEITTWYAYMPDNVVTLHCSHRIYVEYEDGSVQTNMSLRDMGLLAIYRKERGIL